MRNDLFTLYLLVGSILVGMTGALVGTGGGMVLVPMLILIFHVKGTTPLAPL